MKILYVSYVRHGGGDWVHTREFLRALGTLHEPIEMHLPRVAERRGGGFPIDGAHKPDPLREVRYLGGMVYKRFREQYRLLRRVAPDIVVFRACRYTSLVYLCRLLGIPVVLEVNAPMLERRYLEKHEQFRFLPFWCRLEAAVFQAADHLLVVSDALKDYYAGYGLSPSKMTTVPNGVDIDRFHPGVAGDEVRSALGLSDRIVIGFSGSFTPWHGLDFLMEAVKALLRKRPDLRDRITLLLVGNPDEKHRRVDPGTVPVVMTGRVPYSAMPAYIAAMDIVAAPYPRIEPFYFSPLKIVEAMASGLPVIASAQGQIRELLQDNETGVLYPPGDYVAFNRKLEGLIENPERRQRLGKRARERAVSKYTWHANAGRILDICRHVLAKRR